MANSPSFGCPAVCLAAFEKSLQQLGCADLAPHHAALRWGRGGEGGRWVCLYVPSRFSWFEMEAKGKPGTVFFWISGHELDCCWGGVQSETLPANLP